MTIKEAIAPHIVDTISQLRQAGFETYIVGGAVRDALMGREPKDYDISTSATPTEIRYVFGRRRTLAIGRRFRIIHLHHGNEVIEISTFRKEPPKHLQSPPPRLDTENLPENLIFHDNEFGTAQEDAWRRDFTINAIFYDPLDDRIVDHTGMGLDDLHAGVVRCIGDPAVRFEEDPVRILRALKLVGQYGFHLHPTLANCLTNCLELITHSSPSRLSLELEKILKNPYSDGILKTFSDAGFLKYFLPFLDKHRDSKMFSEMLDLLRIRNERTLRGIYRNSVSLAIALITVPFLRKELEADEDHLLWENYTGIEYDLRDKIFQVFAPRGFCRRLSASAVKNLLILPKLLQKNRSQKLLTNPAYSHGRELLVILDKALWNLEWPETQWPAGPGFRGGEKKRRPGRSHRQRPRGRN